MELSKEEKEDISEHFNEQALFVHNHFKEQLTKGNFEIIKRSKCNVHIKVFAKYDFYLWSANMDYGIETIGDLFYKSYMTIEFTDEEKKKVWEHIKK